jgi:CubicO group peptidase (beta-lactamase class C family)
MRSKRRRILTVVTVVGALASVMLVACQTVPPTPAHLPMPGYRPVGTTQDLGLAGYAKILCSAVFVSERDPAEAAKNSGDVLMASGRDQVTWHVDREQKVVRTTLDGVTREARFFGDQGCIIQRPDRPGIFFKPVPVTTTLPDAMSQPWPMGDRLPDEPLPPEIDRAKLDAAVEAAFAPAGLTTAFVVVYKGHLIAERYMPGITKDTQLENWSMGKSLTSTLFALLVKDGTYTLEQPAPVPEWRAPGDPRGRIRVMDLRRMSSGLRFVAPRDPDYTPDKGYPDHLYIYTGAVDVFEYSVNQPLQFPVNTEGRYRNCDPLTIGYLIKQAVTRRGEEYLTYPQRALFDRIGIRRQVLETDPYGNFVLSGYNYGTARNWARLGLLYLQDGMWQGQRLLPDGWAVFVSTPAPAWSQRYGGFFWLNRTGVFNLPKDAYVAAGAGGQIMLIVPSRQLVIVRLGHSTGSQVGMRALNNALGLLTTAIRRP